MLLTSHGAISTFVFFFILLNFLGEVHNTNPSTQSAAANAPEMSQCAKGYLEKHMKEAAKNTREFIIKDIRKRLNDKSMVVKERRCLILCSKAYENAGQIMARGAADVSHGKYAKAVKDMIEYSKAIIPCMQCSTEAIVEDTEFMSFQIWAKSNAEDLLDELRNCPH